MKSSKSEKLVLSAGFKIIKVRHFWKFWPFTFKPFLVEVELLKDGQATGRVHMVPGQERTFKLEVEVDNGKKH